MEVEYAVFAVVIVIHDENSNPGMDLALLNAFVDQRSHLRSYHAHCGNYLVDVNLLQWTRIVIFEQQCGRDLVGLVDLLLARALYEAMRCFVMRKMVLSGPSFVIRLRRLFDEHVDDAVLRSRRALLLVCV